MKDVVDIDDDVHFFDTYAFPEMFDYLRNEFREFVVVG